MPDFPNSPPNAPKTSKAGAEPTEAKGAASASPQRPAPTSERRVGPPALPPQPSNVPFPPSPQPQGTHPAQKAVLPPPPKREVSAPETDPSLPPGPFLFEESDEGSIAHAFDVLLLEGNAASPGLRDVDLTPVRELFAELAAGHMRHVRDFMIDVKWGEATREWIEICVPAVVSLRRASERLDLPELGTYLEAFGEELSRAQSGHRTLSSEDKERLLSSYEKLEGLMPQAFALDRDRSQREAVIIQALFLSVPDVRKVTIDKLYAAGLTSLEVLFAAKADEIAQVAGIHEGLAKRIVQRFGAYRTELSNASPQDARAAERERLAMLTKKLREHHHGYEEAKTGWSPEAKAKKRELFRAREETWLEVSLLLARFGEVERLKGIEKIPFERRIAQLTDYLEEARDKYRLDG